MRQDWKRSVMVGIVLVALFGVAAAFRNLPVRTGCGYYGGCPSAAARGGPATVDGGTGRPS